jgi:hypothetical protein
MGDHIPGKATDNGETGEVKGKEVFLCHFLGLAYPNTPATIAPRIER